MNQIFLFLFLIANTALRTQPDSYENPSPSEYVPVESSVSYKLGDRILKISSLHYGVATKALCFNLHDNEGTSVEAAKEVLKVTGGTLLKIENNKQRVIRFRLKGITYAIDPNRIFSRTGIEQTLRENRKISNEAIIAVEGFAKYLLELVPDSIGCLIALHNNTEEMFSVKSYLHGGNRQRDAKAVYADSLQDPDDIAFTTDSLLYTAMADLRYNSIWQDNENVKKDGSLSVYYGEKKRRYINIETQHGRKVQYIKMLKNLFEYLDQEATKDSTPFTDTIPAL